MESETIVQAKERPILFSTPMVQAILEGRKTVTRRVIKDEIAIDILTMIAEKGPIQLIYRDWCEDDPDEGDGVHPPEWLIYDEDKDWVYPLGQGYGKEKDILWVRETWRKYRHVDAEGYTHWDKEIIEYAADNPPMIPMIDADGFHMEDSKGNERYIPWKPSIHMPKAACRLKLEIVSIGVERLQDITEEDAKREGASDVLTKDDITLLKDLNWVIKRPFGNYQFGFLALWCRINGIESWEANPWVWRIEFKKI